VETLIYLPQLSLSLSFLLAGTTIKAISDGETFAFYTFLINLTGSQWKSFAS
jgi:hypothetical protein